LGNQRNVTVNGRPELSHTAFLIGTSILEIGKLASCTGRTRNQLVHFQMLKDIS